MGKSPIDRPTDRPINRKLYLIFAIVVLSLDQFTKYLIETNMSLHESFYVMPLLDIVSVRNVGSAFGLFKGLGNAVFITLATLAVLALSGLIVFGKRDHFSLALLLGGALGNVTDRIVRGYVVDFLYFHVSRYYWPAFNVADSALTVGIILLIISQLKGTGHGTG
ncbi:MAG: signal peptidase II [Nitrospirae bacterium]|nr:signal peptidase II [Nitrospirota bacterium]